LLAVVVNTVNMVFYDIITFVGCGPVLQGD